VTIILLCHKGLKSRVMISRSSHVRIHARVLSREESWLSSKLVSESLASQP